MMEQNIMIHRIRIEDTAKMGGRKLRSHVREQLIKVTKKAGNIMDDVSKGLLQTMIKNALRNRHKL